MGIFGFKPPYIGKRTSKKTLKCHCVHLGPARFRQPEQWGFWGIKPIPNCKNT
ncbi:Hypothetical protein FKW44_008738, partial [Caligus rogercresseyi]